MNSTLLRRLKYYGIGFGFGLIFVFFFFRNRGCSWLPENRVKNAILDRVLVISDESQLKMNELGLTEDDLVSVLNDGDVDFGASNKDEDSKVYLITKDEQKYFFTLPKESFISEVFFEGDANDIKNSETGYGNLFHFPMDDNLVFVDSSDVLTCQQEALGLIDPRKILEGLKESGRIDFSKSALDLNPKPEHFIEFQQDSLMIGAKMIWYKNKLDVINLYFEGDECE